VVPGGLEPAKPENRPAATTAAADVSAADEAGVAEVEPAAKPAKKAAKKAVEAQAPVAEAADQAAQTPATDDVAATEPAKKVVAKKTAAVAAEPTPEPAAEVPSPEASSPKAKKPAAKKATSPVESPAAEKVSLLKLHHLRPAPGANTPKTRVGRGEASKGKTAGRGTKGTKARYQVPARFEGGQMPIHMRLPKLRGFKNPFRVEYQVVNLTRLGELFPDGGSVTVDDLVARGAVRKGHLVKVLGDGQIAVKLDLTVDAYSASAKEKIEAAGGSVNS
jgi:large subunit ribosomal protein L15